MLSFQELSLLLSLGIFHAMILTAGYALYLYYRFSTGRKAPALAGSGRKKIHFE